MAACVSTVYEYVCMRARLRQALVPGGVVKRMGRTLIPMGPCSRPYDCRRYDGVPEYCDYCYYYYYYDDYDYYYYYHYHCYYHYYHYYHHY